MKSFKWIASSFLLMFSIGSQANDFFDYKWNQNDPLIYEFIDNNRDKIKVLGKSFYMRSTEYRNYIEEQAKEYGVPKEIFVLAAIESAYRTKVVSSGNAVGMWQFLKETSIDMGLTVNSKVDERENWKKSTVAAVKYIKYLADEHFMGNYELAILSYNAGLGRVKRAIYANQTADVWELIKDKKTFPKESREYLPKFIVYAHYFSYLDKENQE